MGQNSENEIEVLAARCAQILNNQFVRPRAEDFYAHLPLCLLDAIISINVRYEIVEKVIARYCGYFGLTPHPSDVSQQPAKKEQQSVAQFITAVEELGVERFAGEVLVNRNRTSPVNGILKAEAALCFAQVLVKHGVNYLQDLPKIQQVERVNNLDVVVIGAAFERDIKEIRGQRSGIALQYFFMLAGVGEFVKPDRMVLGFLYDTLGRAPRSEKEAVALLGQTASKLRADYPHLTAALLDGAVWKYQRSIPGGATAKRQDSEQD